MLDCTRQRLFQWARASIRDARDYIAWAKENEAEEPEVASYWYYLACARLLNAQTRREQAKGNLPLPSIDR